VIWRVGGKAAVVLHLRSSREPVTGDLESQATSSTPLPRADPRSDDRRESAVRIVERESEPTVHAETFFSLAASYLSVGTGACRGGGACQGPRHERPYRRVKTE
jgi:hypothetical protein